MRDASEWLAGLNVLSHKDVLVPWCSSVTKELVKKSPPVPPGVGPWGLCLQVADFREGGRRRLHPKVKRRFRDWEVDGGLPSSKEA